MTDPRWGDFAPIVKGGFAGARESSGAHKACMSTKLSARLRKRLKDLGWSQQRLAEESSLPFGTVQNIFKSGRTTDPYASTLLAIARAVDRDPRWLSGDIDNEGPALKSDGPTLLPIRHRVRAGSFREKDQDEYLGDGPAPVPDAFQGLRQWWEIVEGDSIDEIYPAGALIRVVDADDISYVARPGDLVVVERTRDGLTERSVKEIVMHGDRPFARAKSRNPRWNGEIELTPGASADEVRVAGLVLDAFLPRR